MITIINSNPSMIPVGDLIFDHIHIIDSIHPETSKALPIPINNAFKFLNDIDICTIPLESGYECPFITGNRFFGIYPIGIQLQYNSTIDKYRIGRFASQDFNYLFDLEFQKSNIRQLLELNNPFLRTFIGSGYTMATLPSDGQSMETNASVRLSNGDSLLVKTFIWYNK